MPSESNHGGSRVASYAVCVVLALLAAMYVLFWTCLTLLIGAAVTIVVVLALTALRNRKR